MGHLLAVQQQGRTGRPRRQRPVDGPDFPTCTGAQIRTSLGKSALDLGTAGRDTKYGFGLVQAKAAYDRIKALGCGM